MALNEKQLLDKKNEIQQAKAKLSELKGSEKTLLRQLKEDWECSTLIEAKKKIKKFEYDINELQIDIDKKTKSLEELYAQEESEG